MGMNYYMFPKNQEAVKVELADVLRDVYLPAEDGQKVLVKPDLRVHIAKCSWGWKPNFQATPSNANYWDEHQRMLDSHYKIESVQDIRDYYATGEYIIETEDGEPVTWDEFERRVIEWESWQARARELDGLEPFEPLSHIGSEWMDTYADPEGYEFSRLVFS